MSGLRGFLVKTGVAFEKSNLTGYAGSRHMHLTCPICGLRFHRPPSHVARNKVSTTCSRGCASESLKVRIETECVSCGASMEQTPSNAARVTTCSKECSTLRRVKNIKTVKRSLGAYVKASREICGRQSCEKCGANSGPWVVRNLEASIDESGRSYVDSSAAELWCRKCHLIDVAPMGAVERVRKYGR